MATSDSFNFTLQRNDLIKKALQKVGAVSPDETPTAAEYSDGSDYLNLLLKSWHNEGLQLWRTTQVSISPPTASNTYTFGDGTYTTYMPVDVLEAYRVETSTDTWVQLNRVSRDTFYRLSDHDSTGTPVNYYYNNAITTGTLMVWPIADTTFIANSTIEVLLTKPFDDMDSSTDTLAFPQGWELAVLYGLAAQLAPDYGLPASDQKMLIAVAEKLKEDALSWDMEHTSVFFTPDRRNYGNV